MNERLCRQVACIGEAKQQAISDASVIIVGLGGVGSVVAPQLAKMGVGELTLVDKDIVELHNTSRQMYTARDVSKPKALVAAERLKKINPDILINVFCADVAHLTDVTISPGKQALILDCTDNIEARWEIDRISKKYKIPWIYAAVMGYTGRVKVFTPNCSVKLDRIVPKSFNGDAIPSPHDIGTIVPAVELVGSVQVMEALKILWKEQEHTDCMYYISAYPEIKVEKINLA